MAGHSKWANIKHRKMAQDARRGKIFSKLAREIMIAARLGGGDPSKNPRLRAVIEKARSYNMPKENIERAIKKGTGELGGEAIEQVVYEGYGPGGVAVMVEVMTDNKNRTVQEIRKIFAKHGGNLGEPGSVAWNFERKGIIVVPADSIDEDTLIEVALDAGAEDVRRSGDDFEVITDPDSFSDVVNALRDKNVKITRSEITMMPKSTVYIDGANAERLLKLLDALEEHDDVQNVYANFEIPDDVLAKMAS